MFSDNSHCLTKHHATLKHFPQKHCFDSEIWFKTSASLSGACLHAVPLTYLSLKRTVNLDIDIHTINLGKAIGAILLQACA